MDVYVVMRWDGDDGWPEAAYDNQAAATAHVEAFSAADQYAEVRVLTIRSAFSGALKEPATSVG